MNVLFFVLATRGVAGARGNPARRGHEGKYVCAVAFIKQQRRIVIEVSPPENISKEGPSPELKTGENAPPRTQPRDAMRVRDCFQENMSPANV